MWTPSAVLKPYLRVSSCSHAIFSSAKWQVSHADAADDLPLPAPADVMQVPPSGLLLELTTVRGMIPLGASGCAGRTMGLKLTRPSLSANSCSLRNSRSAG